VALLVVTLTFFFLAVGVATDYFNKPPSTLKLPLLLISPWISFLYLCLINNHWFALSAVSWTYTTHQEKLHNLFWKYTRVGTLIVATIYLQLIH